MTARLLAIAAFVESLGGMGLMAAPGLAIALLVGVQPDSVGMMIGRVAGAALVALGIACWGARSAKGGAAYMGTLRAITFYNAAAGLLLLVFASSGQTRGLVVWIAAALHLGLAAAGVVSLRRPENL